MNTTLLLVTDALSFLSWIATARGNAGLVKLISRVHTSLALVMAANKPKEVTTNDGAESGSDGSGAGSGSSS